MILHVMIASTCFTFDTWFTKFMNCVNPEVVFFIYLFFK